MQESVTSLSLLCRLREPDQDEEGWHEFVQRYGTKIYNWCLYRNLQPSDAEDVTQTVLVKLAAQLRQFEYDPSQSFRGWLRRITENAIKDYLRSLRSRQIAAGGSNVWELLSQVEASRELHKQLQETFDLELAELAMSRVQSRVNENRWQAWFLSARERRSGAEVAAELNMKIASVYTARNQVEKLIREEIQTLEGESPPD